jgi:hypothetical protein
VSDRICAWPDCNGRALFRGSDQAEHLHFCSPHANDMRAYWGLATHQDELSPVARFKYEKTKTAYIAMALDPVCRTFGEWLAER